MSTLVAEYLGVDLASKNDAIRAEAEREVQDALDIHRRAHGKLSQDEKILGWRPWLIWPWPGTSREGVEEDLTAFAMACDVCQREPTESELRPSLRHHGWTARDEDDARPATWLCPDHSATTAPPPSAKAPPMARWIAYAYARAAELGYSPAVLFTSHQGVRKERQAAKVARDRIAFELREQGAGLKEIAAAVGCSITSAHDAVRRVKRQVENDRKKEAERGKK